MCRPYVDRLPGFRVDPSAKNPTARKCETMRPIAIDHRQFHVTVKWRGIYRIPLHVQNYLARRMRRFDLDHHASYPAVISNSCGLVIGELANEEEDRAVYKRGNRVGRAANSNLIWVVSSDLAYDGAVQRVCSHRDMDGFSGIRGL